MTMMNDFQRRVDKWMNKCFGEVIKKDTTERNFHNEHDT